MNANACIMKEIASIGHFANTDIGEVDNLNMIYAHAITFLSQVDLRSTSPSRFSSSCLSNLSSLTKMTVGSKGYPNCPYCPLLRVVRPLVITHYRLISTKFNSGGPTSCAHVGNDPSHEDNRVLAPKVLASAHAENEPSHEDK
ncbi:hypothetical protein GQ457_16G021170 [Hibiscus cannabinus]